MMKQILFATSLLTATAFGLAASAQSSADPGQALAGKQANSFMIRARAISVTPLDASSDISAIGGHVNTTVQFAPEVDFSYFLTDNIAFELIAATTRHNVSGEGTAFGKVDVGSVWALPPTLTAQYHFMPHSAFSPYVGVGVNATFFYNARPAKPVVTHVSFEDNVGVALQVGCDYNFSGHWFANVDVKQIFLNTTAHARTVLGPVTANTALDPLVIGVGIGYRF
jgi:outer membrane protein